jgi:hypothetical protein
MMFHIEHAADFIKTAESYRLVTSVKFAIQAQIRYFDQGAYYVMKD